MAKLTSVLVIAAVACWISQVWCQEIRQVDPPTRDGPLTEEEINSYTLNSVPASEFVGTIPQPATAGMESWSPALNNVGVGGSEVVDPFIINGWNVSTRGEIPWQAWVNMDNSYLCGGSLISDAYVLTAAHCTEGITTFYVTVGLLVRSNDNTTEPGRVRLTTSVRFQHEQYNNATLENDIAIIQLPCRLSIPTEFINVVRLPRQSDATTTYAGATAMVCGFGRVADPGPSSQNLKCANVTVATNAACGSHFNIYASTICAHTNYTQGTQSSCQGDSGGPLTVKEPDGSWTLIGVVSFGGSSCENGIYVGFARVTSFMTWISSKTGIQFRP